MVSRLKLHDVLLTFNKKVYYQPPASKKMEYPCIRYKLDKLDTEHANNKTYMFHNRYQITIIDEDPDSEMVDKIKMMPLCVFDRHYTSDNLNHWVFKLYY